MIENVIRIKQQETILSPFSGEPAEINGEPNSSDQSLLFIYLGMIGEFSYVSDSLTEKTGKGQDDISIDDVVEFSGTDGVAIFESDGEWNGLVYYGFSQPK